MRCAATKSGQYVYAMYDRHPIHLFFLLQWDLIPQNVFDASSTSDYPECFKTPVTSNTKVLSLFSYPPSIFQNSKQNLVSKSFSLSPASLLISRMCECVCRCVWLCNVSIRWFKRQKNVRDGKKNCSCFFIALEKLFHRRRKHILLYTKNVIIYWSCVTTTFRLGC